MRAYVCTPAILTSTRPSLHDNLYNVIIGGCVTAAGGLAEEGFINIAIAIVMARSFHGSLSAGIARETDSR